MKFKSLFLATVLACTTASFAQEKGEQLFTQKCSVCHVMQIPEDKSTMAGPPARGLMFHMSEVFSSKEDIQSHIVDFVLNPTTEKAKLKAVKRFGLMPSQKGVISEDELKIVAKWMVKNLHMSATEHKTNQQKHKKQ